MFLLLPLFLPTPDDGLEVLRSSCLDCHSSEEPKGSFDLEEILSQQPRARALHRWREVRGMVEAGAMPPRRKLADGDRKAVLDLLEGVEAQALELGGGGGREPIRRLTRTELERSLRGVLGVAPPLETLLPDELVGENGFEASSASLFLHPTWLERAGVASRIAVELALPDEGPSTLPGAGAEPGEFLGSFLRLAFRRPVAKEELAGYRARYDAGRQAGLPHRRALRETLTAALASPHFLMRVEDPASPEGGPVSAHGLASRLSYFLWAATPDGRLLDLADSGTLLDEEVLAEEITRMLADERSLSLGRVFAGQWLGVHVLGTRVKPDPIDVPFMTDSVMAAMREEIALLIHALLVEDRPLDDLLLADFTFVDPELARFYGIEEPAGEGPRRIEVKDQRRQGLLGKAAVLATTSYPGRTSPVLRGAWILEDLLGLPSPPPPPDAGELNDELAEREELSPRQKLERHRREATCAACHDRIDPLGFALEGYDHFGRTREHGHEGERIDDRGTLPDGTSFRGLKGLNRVLLAKHRNDLAREASRRMLAYALGRPLTWEDEVTVVGLAGTLSKEGWGALVRAVVSSRPFLYQEPPR